MLSRCLWIGAIALSAITGFSASPSATPAAQPAKRTAAKALRTPAGAKPAAKAKPAPASAISIDLSEDAPVPSGASTSRAATTSGNATAASAIADMEKGMAKLRDYASDPTIPENTKKLMQSCIDSLEEMVQRIVDWRRTVEPLEKAQGLTPDFRTIGELNLRIGMYEKLGTRTDELSKHLKAFPAQLDKRFDQPGISSADAAKCKSVLLSSMQLQAVDVRMRIVSELCGTAVSALNILKDEWGHWNHTGSALEVDDKFPDDKLSKYNALTDQYKAHFSKLEAAGGLLPE